MGEARGDEVPGPAAVGAGAAQDGAGCQPGQDVRYHRGGLALLSINATSESLLTELEILKSRRILYD